MVSHDQAAKGNAIALVSKRGEEEREHLLQELETERSFLQTVVEQIPAGVAIAEAPFGKLILGNKELKNIWRFAEMPPDLATGFSQVTIFHPYGQPLSLEEWPLRRSLEHGELVSGEEVDVIRGDGSRCTLRVSAAPIRDSEGKVAGCVSTCIDITDRRRAEEDLRLRAEHLRFTFDQSNNYPNPFNPSTTIKYQIPRQSFVPIRIYDVLGNEIATLVNEEKSIR